MSSSESHAPLYDRIGTGYDVTRRADRHLVERLIDHLNPEPRHTYLDIACGTGNYTVAVAQTGIRYGPGRSVRGGGWLPEALPGHRIGPYHRGDRRVSAWAGGLSLRHG
jgi:hypothetical protein